MKSKSNRVIYTKTPLQFTDFGEVLVGELQLAVFAFVEKYEGKGIKATVLRHVIRRAFQPWLKGGG